LRNVVVLVFEGAYQVQADEIARGLQAKLRVARLSAVALRTAFQAGGLVQKKGWLALTGAVRTRT